MHSRRILFIGTFLSSKKGTKSISEKLKSLLAEDPLHLIYVSYKKNKVVRLIDIVQATIRKSYSLAHIDVFSNQAFRIAEIATIILKIRKKDIVLNLRGGQLVEFYAKSPERVDRVFRRANKIISPSKFLINEFEKHNYKVTYLPNFLVADQFPFGSFDRVPNTILWVRAFSSIYNPSLAIRAVKLLRDKIPDIKLIMVGPDDGLLEEVRTLTNQLGLDDHVEFMGAVQNNLLAPLYRKYSVYLNTTSYESFGVSVMEAAASGIPVVTTKVGELPYIWDEGEEMLFFNEDDAASCAKKLILILSAPDFARSLADKAYQKSRRYEWKIIKPEWIKLLNETAK